jgi:hypothetical protein
MGKTAPKQTLLKTIIPRAVVTAIDSTKPVRNTMDRMKPAILKITDKDAAILISRFRNWFRVASFRVPKASPRMTEIHY